MAFKIQGAVVSLKDQDEELSQQFKLFNKLYEIGKYRAAVVEQMLLLLF